MELSAARRATDSRPHSSSQANKINMIKSFDAGPEDGENLKALSAISNDFENTVNLEFVGRSPRRAASKNLINSECALGNE